MAKHHWTPPGVGSRKEAYLDGHQVILEIAPAEGHYPGIRLEDGATTNGYRLVVRQAPHDVMLSWIIHEAMHEAFPTMKEKMLDEGDDRFRRYLEALGADFSGILKELQKAPQKTRKPPQK